MLPPAIVLGGSETALAVARSLGRRGVRVVVSAPHGSPATRSRFCAEARTYPKAGQAAAFWHELLLGSSRAMSGAVLLAACDEAIAFIAGNYGPLAQRYLLDMRRPELQLALLDKQRTLELGRAAGVLTPSFWRVDGAGDLERALEEVRYPVLVKPLHSHLFRAAFGGRKHFRAHDADQLVREARVTLKAGIGFMLCEMIPGPDSLLSSYYTYVTARGERLFDFTKRVLRRYPANEGGATYHLTEWLPATASAGRRFFEGIGFEGLGNVEFKLDPRDGRLKLIECNARFTAAQALVARAGIDTAWIAYCGARGEKLSAIDGYREHLCLWYPQADFRAFRQVRREGGLSTASWLRSLVRPKVLPYFAWDDPAPSFSRGFAHLRKLVRRRFLPFMPRNAPQRSA